MGNWKNKNSCFKSIDFSLKVPLTSELHNLDAKQHLTYWWHAFLLWVILFKENYVILKRQTKKISILSLLGKIARKPTITLSLQENPNSLRVKTYKPKLLFIFQVTTRSWHICLSHQFSPHLFWKQSISLFFQLSIWSSSILFKGSSYLIAPACRKIRENFWRARETIKPFISGYILNVRTSNWDVDSFLNVDVI